MTITPNNLQNALLATQVRGAQRVRGERRGVRGMRHVSAQRLPRAMIHLTAFTTGKQPMPLKRRVNQSESTSTRDGQLLTRERRRHVAAAYLLMIASDDSSAFGQSNILIHAAGQT
jgi:hypothetical protein